MFRARTNTLQLNWRNRFTGGDENCDLYKEGIETLEHFLIDCIDLQPVREKYITREINIEKILLFIETDQSNQEHTIEKHTRYIEELWNTRNKKIRPDL